MLYWELSSFGHQPGSPINGSSAVVPVEQILGSFEVEDIDGQEHNCLLKTSISNMRIDSNCAKVSYIPAVAASL